MAVRKVMRLGRAGTLTFFVLALVFAALISVALAAKPAQAATITVNTNADDSTANTNCTLREAITAANTNAAVDACTSGAAGADTINFAIPGAGPHTISPTSDLPSITEAVTINGYSESLDEGTTPARPNSNADLAQGTNANLLIELSGGSISSSNGLIQINASDVVVKGLVLKCFNSGIFIFGGSGNVIKGNFIGNDPSVCTVNDGVVVTLSSHDNTIGGTSPAARNLISGNSSEGLNIAGNGGNTIQGNLIGTRANGTDPLGNTEGVDIGSPNNTIGGIDRDLTDNNSPANLIAYNGLTGVTVFGTPGFSAGNRILSNSIFENGSGCTSECGLGIDLTATSVFSPDGVTANDKGDGDEGANNLQNFPRLISATTASGTTTIDGTLNSRPGNTFIIQLFSSAQADNSSFGEGEVYLGRINVKTKDNGIGRFTFAVNRDLSGQVVTATATRVSTRDTSEFSRALEVS
jgi:CSLREA domain-containing protein